MSSHSPGFRDCGHPSHCTPSETDKADWDGWCDFPSILALWGGRAVVKEASSFWRLL